MSAWIVSEQHINAMVFIILRSHSTLDDRNPNELGRMLWRENVNSVSHRYRGEPIADLPGPIALTEESQVDNYTYTEPMNKPNPGDVAQIFNCYDYQSCEHPEWETSEAKRICDAVIAATEGVAQNPHTPWGWDLD